MIKTETLWREPDSLGKIYPLITINEERTAKHQTDKNIVAIRADTLHITDNTDNTSTVETRHATSLRWLLWVLLLVVVVLGLMTEVIGRRSKD